MAAVNDLASDPRPHGCTKIQDSDLAYRIRIGDYQVVYEIYENRLVIEIVRVSFRRDVYLKK